MNKLYVGEPNLYRRVSEEMKLSAAEQQRRHEIRSAQFKHITMQRFLEPWERGCTCKLCTGERGYWELN